MIKVERETPWPELEAQIRGVEMLLPRGGEVVHPYANASISLQRFYFGAIRTTSFYVLRRGLAKQTEIAGALAGKYDPLELEGGLVLTETDSAGAQTTVGLVPPIVEETMYDGVYLLDGSHRANRAIWSGVESFVGIHIKGIRPDCPSYAFPNEWDAVRIYDYTPAPHLRKKYREPEQPNVNYRNFGPVNGSAPRLTERE
jgi:hypothetical protein